MIQQAMEKFPDLENYSYCWPVNDMVMMHLKYTSSRARRKTTVSFHLLIFFRASLTRVEMRAR